MDYKAAVTKDPDPKDQQVPTLVPLTSSTRKTSSKSMRQTSTKHTPKTEFKASKPFQTLPSSVKPASSVPATPVFFGLGSIQPMPPAEQSSPGSSGLESINPAPTEAVSIPSLPISHPSSSVMPTTTSLPYPPTQSKSDVFKATNPSFSSSGSKVVPKSSIFTGQDPDTANKPKPQDEPKTSDIHDHMIEPPSDYSNHAQWLNTTFPESYNSKRAYFVSMVLKIKSLENIGSWMSLRPDQWYEKLGHYTYAAYIDIIIELVVIWHFLFDLTGPVKYSDYEAHQDMYLVGVADAFTAIFDKQPSSPLTSENNGSTSSVHKQPPMYTATSKNVSSTPFKHTGAEPPNFYKPTNPTACDNGTPMEEDSHSKNFYPQPDPDDIDMVESSSTNSRPRRHVDSLETQEHKLRHKPFTIRPKLDNFIKWDGTSRTFRRFS